jgi:hypothetical protein
MKRGVLILVFVLLILGCTQELSPYATVTGDYETASEDYDLDVLVTDNFNIRRNNLFSGEMTRLTLNLINLASVDFNNVHVRVINADDLNPTTTMDSVEVIESNHSEKFEWDLTAPTLAIGETLLLDNIIVRTYYETFAETTKAILLKEPGDRAYVSTFTESSETPLAIYFDTSYETVTTLNNSVKNFTVNLIFFNNYSGVVDYFDNSDIDDNYLRRVVVGIDKNLIFYNYFDDNSPWQKIEESWSEEQLLEYGLEPDDLLLKNYYYLEYLTIESQGYDLCNLQGELETYTSCVEDTCDRGEDDYEECVESCENSFVQELKVLQSFLTEQRRVLWMTRGFTKVNVLRLGAQTVQGDTEVQLSARAEYSYSQDYGGEGFGVVVYGLG